MSSSQRVLGAVLILALVSVLFVPPSLAAIPDEPAPVLDSRTSRIDRALAWLRTMQQPDGSFAASPGTTIEVVLAITAAGQDPALWRSSTTNLSPLDYLSRSAERYATDPAAAGKLVVGVVAAGYDPESFAGQDLVARLIAASDGSGALGGTTLGQAWALLGLLSARQPLPQGAVEALTSAQQDDGGWEGAPGWGADSNISALALQALIGAGLSAQHQAMVRGRSYLAAQQSATGGFSYSSRFGVTSDANSTAYAIQALIALGQNPLAEAWSKGGLSAWDDLVRFQRPSGAFEWQLGQGDNLLATAQAVVALLGKPLPLRGVGPAIRSALAYLRTAQQADGSFPGGFGSNLVPSAQALMTLAIAGENPRSWRGSGGLSLLDYLRREASSVQDAGAAGLLITALSLVHEDPRAAGTDLIAVLRRAYDPGTGALDAHQNIYNHALAIWGLVSADEQVPAAALSWLVQQQNKDGGWGWASGQNSDSNSTAVVLQALLSSALPAQDPRLGRAIAYLQRQQTADGGFAYDIALGPASDANSTAYGIQALLAAGVDPAIGWSWAVTAAPTLRKPADALLALQRADGAFEWQAGAGPNILATIQAIPALARATFPRGRALRAGGDADHPVALANNAPLAAELVGDRAGSFAYYGVDSPGGGRKVTIQVRFDRADPAARRGLGFNVYGPNGRLLGRGTAAGDVSSGVMEARLDASVPALWLVQVYNYLPNAPASYSVVAQGLAEDAKGPTTQRPDAEPAGATVLETFASGELVGSHGGSFVFLKLTYPGDGSTTTLHLTFTPADAILSRGVGFAVYSPLGEVLRGETTGVPGERQASWASRARGIYLVQIYNYNEGANIRYMVRR